MDCEKSPDCALANVEEGLMLIGTYELDNAEL